MTLSFHFGNHAHMLIMHACIFVLVSTCVTEWVMHIKEGNKNWLEQHKQKTFVYLSYGMMRVIFGRICANSLFAPYSAPHESVERLFCV